MGLGVAAVAGIGQLVVGAAATFANYNQQKKGADEADKAYEEEKRLAKIEKKRAAFAELKKQRANEREGRKLIASAENTGAQVGGSVESSGVIGAAQSGRGQAQQESGALTTEHSFFTSAQNSRIRIAEAESRRNQALADGEAFQSFGNFGKSIFGALPNIFGTA